MPSNIIKPSERENKTTIQISKDLRDRLILLGSKGENYNQIIERLLTNFEEKLPMTNEKKKLQLGNIKVSDNIIITKYERVTISIKEWLDVVSNTVTLEVTYNKPVSKDDKLYQIDLRIEKVIFDNEVYSPKEFFGVLQKDMIYCEMFLYYYLKSLLEIIKSEFKKSNYLFSYKTKEYFELARWRTFLLNSRLSPEILSHDIESVLSDMKNEKTNTKLIEDVKNSFYGKIRTLKGYNNV